MPGTLAPDAKFTGLDDEGNPLVGGLLHTYIAHTSTPADTYTDVDLQIPNSNPVVLDAGGRATVYLDLLSYKFVLTDKDGTIIWTQDDVVSAGISGGGGAGGGADIGSGVYTFGGENSCPITGPEYPSGAGYENLHSGTGILEVDSATLLGGYAFEAILAVVGEGSMVEAALVNLSDGDPDTPMVAVMSESLDGERVKSDPIVWPLSGAKKMYGVKVRCNQPVGYMWQAKIIRIPEA